ncbi:hypothetical protein CCHL11_02650 [Colletotrichum chlorophyti]|uniref:Peptidase A1 domain-containing protein n=1 Tax=Colletotrichum chlorophyti TaxID=708187 RepID=A0A1Q8S940_9PEZI|nr:hypothetical protein CCHL11_02650 [Colletotrichum chlorophyti]
MASAPLMELSVETRWSKPICIPSAGIDTGSTGIMISASSLGLSETSDFDRSRPGNEFLSSSGRLWQGYWLDANITFHTDEDECGKRQEVVTSVPIMAVTEESICPAWKKQGFCTERQKHNITHWPKDIHYVGVGFGRGSSEQPDALPDKVPFINVASIGGKRADDIHQGYIITKRGVRVGLTSENTERFRKTKLDLRPGSAHNDWKMVNMSIRINDSPWNHGFALFDTGIPHSYVAVYKDVRLHAETVPSRVIRHNPPVLAEGTVVEVEVPDENGPIATYRVVAPGATGSPDPESMVPSGYVMEKDFSREVGPHINTGRMFYNGFEVMFDSQCGWFGLFEISGTKERLSDDL